VRSVRFAAAAAVALALAAPARARAGWSAEDIIAVSKDLSKKLGTPVEKAHPVYERLEAKLKEPGMLARVAGVFAYQMGEGGLILKVKKGKGLARLRKGGDRPLQLNSLSVGAQIGGSSEWGIGLILDLKSEGAFGGEYKGNVRGATAGGASMSVSELRRADVSDEALYHELYLIGNASGLSGNAAGAQLTITVGR
jgi:hypothetical protein